MYMKEEKKFKFARTKLEKILIKADQIGLVSAFSGTDYPEYIHSLWRSITQQPALQEQALAVENDLGLGDTIQLFSDARCELFDKHLESN